MTDPIRPTDDAARRMARGIIDSGSESQGDDRTNPRHRHQQPAHRVILRKQTDLTFEPGQFLAQACACT